MAKVLFFVFEEYADFEIAHTLFFLNKLGEYELITTSINGRSVKSLGGLKINVDLPLNKVDITEFDLILISGGDGIKQILDEKSISDLLINAYKIKIPIASICASATFLAKAGVLNSKRVTCLPGTYENYKELFSKSIYTGKNIEVENGLITAKGTAFPEFTVEVCRMLNLIKSKEQEEMILRFCKGEDT